MFGYLYLNVFHNLIKLFIIQKIRTCITFYSILASHIKKVTKHWLLGNILQALELNSATFDRVKDYTHDFAMVLKDCWM